MNAEEIETMIEHLRQFAYQIPSRDELQDLRDRIEELESRVQVLEEHAQPSSDR